MFVSFIVERDGTMSDAKIVKGVNEEMDNEAMRVVMILPKWIPGRQNGKVVRARYVLPVKFKKR